MSELTDLDAARWRGQPGRLEVWYTTLTDPASSTGFWLHAETVAPTAADPYGHGWVGVFPPDAPASLHRFGPVPVTPGTAQPFAAAGLERGSDGTGEWWRGRADAECTVDLRGQDSSPPLFTFPRWAWERELLPAAQVVPRPSASYSGTITVGPRTWTLERAPGAGARIYGHGNARRWGWLHADLGGGDVLELVSAVSTRPGLRALPPLTFLRLRVAGRDWPADPGLTAPLSRARLALPEWTASVLAGRTRVRVRVHLPAEGSLAVDYTDPDGGRAVCTNSERADAQISLERFGQGRTGWWVERSWELTGSAHAELGLRPA